MPGDNQRERYHYDGSMAQLTEGKGCAHEDDGTEIGVGEAIRQSRIRWWSSGRGHRLLDDAAELAQDLSAVPFLLMDTGPKIAAMSLIVDVVAGH